MNLTVEIPGDLAGRWKTSRRKSTSMIASQPELQRLLGIETRYELDGFLKAHDIWIDYTREDAEHRSNRWAAMRRMPSVPVTSNPWLSAALVPLRSSIKIRSACIDNDRVIAARKARAEGLSADNAPGSFFNWRLHRQQPDGPFPPESARSGRCSGLKRLRYVMYKARRAVVLVGAHG